MWCSRLGARMRNGLRSGAISWGGLCSTRSTCGTARLIPTRCVGRTSRVASRSGADCVCGSLAPGGAGGPRDASGFVPPSRTSGPLYAPAAGGAEVRVHDFLHSLGSMVTKKENKKAEKVFRQCQSVQTVPEQNEKKENKKTEKSVQIVPDSVQTVPEQNVRSHVGSSRIQW